MGPDAGHVHCRLSWSLDAKNWSWVDTAGGGVTGAEFIPAGVQGTFDSHVCFAAHSPVFNATGDGVTHRIYYMGGNGPHSGLRNTSFAVATLHGDRFAGLGSVGASSVTTKEIEVTGGTFIATVDVNTSSGGEVAFSVSGEQGQRLPSGTLAKDCTDCAVAGMDLSSYVGKKVKFTIAVKHAVVFTIGFV